MMTNYEDIKIPSFDKINKKRSKSDSSRLDSEESKES